MFTIAVFRSSTDTHAFNALLKSYGVKSNIESTPRQAEVSCGLCVKFSSAVRKMVFDVFKRRNFASFVAFFQVDYLGNGMAKVSKIVVK